MTELSVFAATVLPVSGILPELLSTLASTNTAILQAPPGSGKTTRVPLALLEAEPDWLAGRHILLLEPRRLAARAAARYMASLLGESTGQRVGYRTRLDSKISATTRIEVVTEGILLRMVQDDPELSRYGVVIFDEFHERNLQSDLGLALTRECQSVFRPDLRLLLMSATLDAEPLSRLLDDAPMLNCPGRQFPVSVSYAPPGRTPLLDHCALMIHQTLQRETGSVLVFLPGESEIRRLQALLQNRLPANTQLCPLYGQLSQAEQDAAIAPAASGQRKVVLATAIAETSLTIEGVRVVIDCGLRRSQRFDPNTGLSGLMTEALSQANAEQRRGRAGRIEPGHCLRLWSEDAQQRLARFATPEICQTDLADLALTLAGWGVRDPQQLIWLDIPPAAAWAQAQDQLRDMQALDSDGRITTHGRHMLALGLSPRLAHLLVLAQVHGQGRLAAEFAALLSERDLLSGPARDAAGSDLRARLAILQGDGHSGSADRGRLQRVKEQFRQLLDRLRTLPMPATSPAKSLPAPLTLGALLALAWPDAIAQKRPGNDGRYLLANGRGCSLRNDDALAGEPGLIAVSLDAQARDAKLFLALPFDLSMLDQLHPERVLIEEVLQWDTASSSVTGRRQRRFDALILDTLPLPRPRPETLLPVFIGGLRQLGADALPWTPALRQWQARVQRLHAWHPADWPDVSDAALMAGLEIWAAPWLSGLSRHEEMSRFPLHDALFAHLDWSQRQRLDEQLPTHLTVPSGSDIEIDYCAEGNPVLAVKLQEVFGWLDTPALAQGRLRLTLHLLSPARRPTAVTADLASFWRQGYPEVRKDLRGRYPKHPWPEDSLTAVAQRGVKHPKPRS
ncbi:MAG: ATP-dependent helicase HrpB [Pseudomonadota bacterium]